MLQQDNFVLKPMSQKPGDIRGEKEAEFYEHVQAVGDAAAAATSTECTVLDAATGKPPGYERALMQFLPRYLGQCEHSGVKYLRLSNVVIPYRKPCIVDIKLGCRSYAADAPLAKQLSEANKWPLQQKLGFRPCGMKLYDQSSGTFEFIDRKECRQVSTEADLAAFFRGFIRGRSPQGGRGARGEGRGSAASGPSDNAGMRPRSVAAMILDKLRALLAWFEAQTAYHFISSSVLITYEGDWQGDGGQARAVASASAGAEITSGTEESTGGKAAVTPPGVRLIDFGHVLRGVGRPDTNCLTGVRSLIALFKRLVDEEGTA